MISPLARCQLSGEYPRYPAAWVPDRSCSPRTENQVLDSALVRGPEHGAHPLSDAGLPNLETADPRPVPSFEIGHCGGDDIRLRPLLRDKGIVEVPRNHEVLGQQGSGVAQSAVPDVHGHL